MSRGPRSAAPELPGFTFDRGIGGGGFADVFLYTQLRPSRSVAIKILRREHLSAQALAQFDAEADIMAEVSTHPYIVTIFSSGVSPDGRPYIVMEHYPLPNFGERAKGGTLDVAEVLRTGIQVASAVETAHRAGIIHRDIKPGNVLTSTFGRPGLTDFGISGVQTEGVLSEATGLTVPYTAPEVLDEKSAGSVASDVYGLAATISAFVSGHSPFWSSTGDNGAQAVLARALSGQITPLTRPDVPNSLKHLLTQAMAANPAHRPASALKFAQALQQIEQELRLQPTPIEVAADDGPRARAEEDDPDGKDRTRRSIQVVNPHAPVASPSTTAPPASALPPRTATPAGPAIIASSAAPPPTVTSFAPPPASPSTTPPSTTPPPTPLSRVPAISTTPSWARATPVTNEEEAETVARPRAGSPPPDTFRVPEATRPPSATPATAPPSGSATATAASTYRTGAPPIAETPTAAPEIKPRPQVPWKAVGAVAALVAVVAIGIVVASSGKRSSTAGPGDDTGSGGPIQSIQTAASLGPVITPNDTRIAAFTVSGTTATSTITWTPTDEDGVVDTFRVIPIYGVSATAGATPTTLGSEPFRVDASEAGSLTVTLTLGSDGTCASAKIGDDATTIPCSQGPPCLEITSHAPDRATGDPRVVTATAGSTATPLLSTAALKLDSTTYDRACAATFAGVN